MFKLRLFLFVVIKIIANLSNKLFLFLFGIYKERTVYKKAYKKIVGKFTNIHGYFIKTVGLLTKTMDEFIKTVGRFTKTMDEFIKAVGEFTKIPGELIKAVGRLTNNIKKVFKTMKEPTERICVFPDYSLSEIKFPFASL